MKLFPIYLMLFFLMACDTEKTIDYAAFYEGDKIVVHGFVNLEKGVRVFVKKTLAPDNINGNDKIVNAKVYLHENGNKILSLESENDYFFVTPNSFFVDPNYKYHISVESPTLSNVYSKQQQIPQITSIDSLKLVVKEYEPSFLKLYYNNQSIDNGYYLKIYEYQEGIIVDSLDYSSSLFDPYNLITHKTTGVKSYKYRTSSEIDSLKVILHTLSPDLIEFCTSYQSYDWTSEDPFYEYTYPVFSNIENGYGLFASFSFDTKTLVTEK
ncbi:MAG TPA: DUF4249 family protein [Lutibacter sp.]|nr:DUF4249 family protein [Lutibacter sp.]